MMRLRALVSAAGRLFHEWNRSGLREQISIVPEPHPAFAARDYQPLERIILTDGVARTLFEEYAAHRQGNRGKEETGWLLLGLREPQEAVALATLPAGTACSAGVAHVRFNSNAQALGSRIVRQHDRRLSILGVVHTHPGTLRHPSDGDYRGDSLWVEQLRGGEGVFGIGTHEARSEPGALFARQPRPHVQSLGELCFAWYALGQGEPDYRPLPFQITLGPDLARPLHPVWPTLEIHAAVLDRLFRQQNRVSFESVNGPQGPALAMTLPLAEPKDFLRVIMRENEARYYLLRDGELLEAESKETHVDRGVYLLLAELAFRANVE